MFKFVEKSALLVNSTKFQLTLPPNWHSTYTCIVYMCVEQNVLPNLGEIFSKICYKNLVELDNVVVNMFCSHFAPYQMLNFLKKIAKQSEHLFVFV